MELEQKNIEKESL